MENKKNYVDGVDVSECKYYDDGTCCDKDVMSISCENSDCIYKQLKRLQAENEQIKKDYAKLHIDFAKCNEENKQLKKSIDRIMQNKEIKTIDLDIAKENAKLKAENERLKEVKDWTHDNLRMALYDKEFYKQALQEIREIVKKEVVCDDCNFEGTDKCDARMCTHFYLNDFSKDIYDKINSVIGAEE